MLRILRNRKTAKKVWIGLAIIIIPAFALWGFGGAFRSREETAPAGKIFGRNIPFTEFRDAIGAEKIMAIMRFGDKLSEVQQYLNLEAQAWERLILLAEAKNAASLPATRRSLKISKILPTFSSGGHLTIKFTMRYFAIPCASSRAYSKN